MLDNEGRWMEEGEERGTLQQVQEALRSGKALGFNNSGCVSEQLKVLEERLLRVRSMGGSYSDVEFSPYIKVLLGGTSETVRCRSAVT